MTRRTALVLMLGILASSASFSDGSTPVAARPRARELGLEMGVLSPGPLNAITDVSGVRVGHFTLKQGTRFNTGITAVLPHGGNLFHGKVPAAIVVGNGFGKLTTTEGLHGTVPALPVEKVLELAGVKPAS